MTFFAHNFCQLFFSIRFEMSTVTLTTTRGTTTPSGKQLTKQTTTSLGRTMTNHSDSGRFVRMAIEKAKKLTTESEFW